VCVVDQTFVNNMRVNNTDFGINSTISIFRQLFKQGFDTIFVGSFDYPYYDIGNPLYPLIFPRAATSATATNGTVIPFTEDALTTSDNLNMTFYSNKTTLEVIIDVNMTVLLGYYMHFISPYNISLESSVNTTINQLDLEVLNHYTGNFDKLGNINNTVEMNNTFTFNQEMPPFSYINQSNSILRLRITGQNSTYDSDFSLNVDTLNFLVFNSMAYI